MKKQNISINHTEILCYAIKAVQAEINDWNAKCSGHAGFEEILEQATSRLIPKLEALKELYRIETGTEYN